MPFFSNGETQMPPPPYKKPIALHQPPLSTKKPFLRELTYKGKIWSEIEGFPLLHTCGTYSYCQYTAKPNERQKRLAILANSLAMQPVSRQ